MHKKLYLSILAALATAAAICLFILLAAPVASSFAWAMIIGISTMPHYNRVLKWVHRPGRAAGLMVVAVMICFILPATALIVTATLNASEWYNQLLQLAGTISRTGADTLRHIPLVDRIAALAPRFGIDFAALGEKAASNGSRILLHFATEAAKNVFSFLFTLAVALFILFFVYRDGERIVDTLIDRLAPDPAKGRHYVSQIRSITTSVTVGTILTCVSQGVLAGIGYYFAGIPAAIFCGALTAIAALVPVVGTGVVWVPLAILLALNGSYTSAVLLSLWCILFVGFADNAIRPLAIGAAGDVPVLAIVLGAICGVVLMGLLGLILGPVIFAVLMSIWGEATADIEPEGKASEEKA